MKYAHHGWIFGVLNDQARAHNVDFYPLVFEAFGRVGGGAIRPGRPGARLASRAAEDRGLSVAAERSRWLELLAVCLQLSQAEALLAG